MTNELEEGGNTPRKSKFRDGLVQHLRGTISKRDEELREAQEKERRIASFPSEFLEVARRIIKPQMDDAVAHLNEIKFCAYSKIIEKLYGGPPDTWPYVEFRFLNRQDPSGSRSIEHNPESRCVIYTCCATRLAVQLVTSTGIDLAKRDSSIMNLDRLTEESVTGLLLSVVQASIDRVYLC